VLVEKGDDFAFHVDILDLNSNSFTFLREIFYIYIIRSGISYTHLDFKIKSLFVFFYYFKSNFKFFLFLNCFNVLILKINK